MEQIKKLLVIFGFKEDEEVLQAPSERESLTTARSGLTPIQFMTIGVSLLEDRQNDFVKAVREQATATEKGGKGNFKSLHELFLVKRGRARLASMMLLPQDSILGDNWTTIPMWTSKKLVSLDQVEDDARVVFISHKWKMSTKAGVEGQKEKQVHKSQLLEYQDVQFSKEFQNTLRAYVDHSNKANKGKKAQKFYFWADYWGVNQEEPKGIWLASIFAYVMMSTDLLVIFEEDASLDYSPDIYSWYNSMWCRLEFAVNSMVNLGKPVFMARVKEPVTLHESLETREVLSPLDDKLYCTLNTDRANLYMNFRTLVIHQIDEDERELGYGGIIWKNKSKVVVKVRVLKAGK